MIAPQLSAALQKTVVAIHFQHHLCTQCHLPKLKYHWLWNKSPNCQLVTLTVCETVLLLVSHLPGQERKGSLTFWKTAFAAGQNLCCQPVPTDDGKAN